MRKLFWHDLTTKEFEALNPETTIAVLPVAATEQHGPHLTVAVDTVINDGMIGELIKRLPDDLEILILPTQAIGKSNEHLRSPGTLTLSAETAMRMWIEIGESVARAGLRKLVMINSHGGNAALLEVVARELRVRCHMLCVHSAWGRFGPPDGMFDSIERMHGIHAGDSETSLMLHFRPDLVRMEKADNFVSSAVAMDNEFAYLRPTGVNAFGWIAQDLHPSGAVGDASKATAERGRLQTEKRADDFIKLLYDVKAFSLSRLA